MQQVREYAEYVWGVAPVAAGYALGRLHQWWRNWRTTPARHRLDRAVDAFRGEG
ncbi:hypothetical protein [Streptomyces sp. NPDC046887]|uniref:hypothetical protein n=1 Tax=Streptomyces sp. NPDC046887 TaxID=3155472 RepID=UPI0033CF828B